MVESLPRPTPSATALNREFKICSHAQSSTSLDRSHDLDKEEKGDEVDAEADEEDIDENDPHGNEYGGRIDEGMGADAVTRTSTKSSWNPGPPPDGGWSGWTQGMHNVL